MSPLLRHPGPGPVTHAITPESAGWRYVGFELIELAAGETLTRETAGREQCLVLQSGRAHATAGDQTYASFGERGNVFEGLPYALYVPAQAGWSLTAETPLELAICSSPAQGKLKPRLITPADIGEETRGRGTNTRHVRNILPDTAEAETLLVVEVITPGGNWSSYPPHKHDTDDFPRETYLEETYYHRLARGSGFALQRVYTEDGSLDETMAIADRDVVLVPKGFHPVGAPHGFDLYYLNVMAGPVRAWKFTMARDHEFLTW